MTETILADGSKTSNAESKSPQEIFLVGDSLLACSNDEARHDRSRFRDVPFLLVQMLVVLFQE